MAMTRKDALVTCLAALPLAACLASCGPGPDGACVIEYTSLCFLFCRGDGISYACTDGIDKSTCESDADAGNTACVSSLECAAATFYPNQTCGDVDCGQNQPCPPDHD
jgi:hypothetical protein